MLAGRADYTFDTPSPSQLRTIQLRYPGQLHTEPLSNTDWLNLNTHEAPFNETGVRQALNDAADRGAIVSLHRLGYRSRLRSSPPASGTPRSTTSDTLRKS